MRAGMYSRRRSRLPIPLPGAAARRPRGATREPAESLEAGTEATLRHRTHAPGRARRVLVAVYEPRVGVVIVCELASHGNISASRGRADGDRIALRRRGARRCWICSSGVGTSRTSKWDVALVGRLPSTRYSLSAVNGPIAVRGSCRSGRWNGTWPFSAPPVTTFPWCLSAGKRGFSCHLEPPPVRSANVHGEGWVLPSLRVRTISPWPVLNRCFTAAVARLQNAN